MAEYIDRDKAVDALLTEMCMTGYQTRAINPIRMIEKEYLAPVRHGRWEEASDRDGIVCSECGTDFCTMIHEAENFAYCPSCGALMNKEGEHEQID